VLGLLVASASASHDRQSDELTSLSADIILLDQTLAIYGPDAQAVRDGIRQQIRRTHDAISSPTGVRPENMNSATVQSAARVLRAQVAAFAPKPDAQQLLKSRAFGLADSIAKSRLVDGVQQHGQEEDHGHAAPTFVHHRRAVGRSVTRDQK
jgi:hypothetical protein